MGFLRAHWIGLTTTVLLAGSGGVATYPAAVNHWPREFLVVDTGGRDSKLDALKLGEIVRKVPGLGYVVVSSNSKTSLLDKNPGLIVEPLVEYTIPQGEEMAAGDWPPPGGNPGQPTDPLPDCPACKCECNCCPDKPDPNPEPPKPDPVPPPEDKEIVDWGVDMMRTVPKFSVTTAKNIKVCIADTGIDKNHEDLKHLAGANFSGGAKEDYQDRQSHGTHCAGAVAAVDNYLGVIGASQAQLLIAKVLTDKGSGSNEGIAAGVKWCIEQGAHVISMSLGGPQPSRVLEYVLRQASDKGILIFAAAGNEGRQSISYPSGYKMTNLYSVSAIDRNGQLARFSSWGKVDVTAPGVDTLSTVPGGYKRMSGTSMATPLAAGCAAMYLSVGKKMALKAVGDPAKFGKGMCTGDGL